MSHFRKPVNDNKDCIVALLRPWKTSDEIHLYFLPFPFRGFQWLQKTERFLMDSFHSAADMTLRYILGTISFQTRPPILCFQVHVHLCAARMDRKNGIMRLLENLLSQTRVVWNKHPVFKEKRALIINVEGLILRKLKFRDEIFGVRITQLTRANLFFQERSSQKVQEMPLFHNFQVELTEFLAQERLLFFHHEVVDISFAAESIGHDIMWHPAKPLLENRVEFVHCIVIIMHCLPKLCLQSRVVFQTPLFIQTSKPGPRNILFWPLSVCIWPI